MNQTLRIRLSETGGFFRESADKATRLETLTKKLAGDLAALNSQDDPDIPWSPAVRVKKEAAILAPIEKEAAPLAARLRELGDLMAAQSEHHSRGARLTRATLGPDVTPALVARVTTSNW